MHVVVASTSDHKIAVYGPFSSEAAAERWARRRRKSTYRGERVDFLTCPVFTAHEQPALAAIALEMAARDQV